jgi:hypothetical protein
VEENPTDGTRRRYTITRLPRYLIIHFRRFQQNNWFIEKNPTLVNFPIKNLDLKPYTNLPPLPEACTEPALMKLHVSELRARIAKANIAEGKQFVEKSGIYHSLNSFIPLLFVILIVSLLPV